MPFEKGKKKTGGRKSGSPDIRREFKDLKTLLEEKGFDPRETLIELAHSDDDRIRIKAIDIMMSRLEPHLKQIEHKGEIAHSHDVTFLRERMNALLEKNKKDV